MEQGKKSQGITYTFRRKLYTPLTPKLDKIRSSQKGPKDCFLTDFEEISAYTRLLYMAAIEKT